MEEDAELQRILELSRLEEEARVERRAQTTSENIDEEKRYTEELAMAMAMSLAQPDMTTTSTADLNSEETTPSALTSNHDGPVGQFLAERKKLEEQRLMRKRARPGYLGEESLDIGPAPAAKRRNTGLTGSSLSHDASRELSQSASTSFFWQGEIRQTANQHATPNKDIKPTFRLSELLGASMEDIKLVVLSSFCNDIPWLAGILPRRAPVILVNQPGPDGKATIVHPVHPDLPSWTMVSPFLRGGHGCMHMKFMLVFYPTRLRVIIPTANFIAYDWRDIENTVWVQDVPLRRSSTGADEPPDVTTADDFPSRLQYALRKLNFAQALARNLIENQSDSPLRDIKDLRRRWDWSAVKVQLIISVPGKFEGGREMGMSGHPALAKSLHALGALCPLTKDLQIECQASGSSIGNYSSAWLTEFLYSVEGKTLATWFSFKESHRRGGIPHPTDIKIVFPSLKTVEASVMGRQGGRSMFCREKQWNGKTFPCHLFYDSRSKRGGILMHSKMILGLFVENPNRIATGSGGRAVAEDASKQTTGGWCYIGSHNFTPSAWGNLSGTAADPILNVMNFEMGICFTLPSLGADARGSEVACWERPPQKYRAGADEPWMQDKHLNLTS
ncbi:hypothetical protein FRB97_005942 [Tulasnella sp. 331]|nr:hypothetical protein FRB97_005942 [Tulasnella sp. 331]